MLLTALCRTLIYELHRNLHKSLVRDTSCNIYRAVASLHSNEAEIESEKGKTRDWVAIKELIIG